MTWQEKAEWLRVHGYYLSVDTCDDDTSKWKAAIEGEGRRYDLTIEGAIEQVFEWVIQSYKSEIESEIE